MRTLLITIAVISTGAACSGPATPPSSPTATAAAATRQVEVSTPTPDPAASTTASPPPSPSPTPPATLTPAPTEIPLHGHALDVRTSDPTVNLVIDAVLARDEDALLELARFERHECINATDSTNEGRGLPPICPSGEQPGTKIDIILSGACHGVVRGTDDLHYDLELAAGDLRVYAVARVADDDGIGAEHVVVFSLITPSGGPFGYGLVTGRGGFVRLAMICGGSAAELLQRQQAIGVLLPPPGDK